MTEMTVIASGLRFPEGPIAMPDGSVVLVEIARGTVSRVTPDGAIHVVAETGGGPNGAALGPDGAVYVCNNGGFEWSESEGLLHPGRQPETYTSGSIDRVDLATGAVTRLYTQCDGVPLRGPNDLVFDRSGGLWFTDLGKTRRHDRDHGAVYWCRPDGSAIRRVVHQMNAPNGIGLSPDEQTLYVAETPTGRLWGFRITGPGQIERQRFPSPNGGFLVAGLPGYQLFDSLAVDAEGNVCVATLMNGGITIISPDGARIRHVPMPDPYTTNICFGGPDLRTAYITLSGSGRLVSCPWERPGLALNFLNN